METVFVNALRRNVIARWWRLSSNDVNYLHIVLIYNYLVEIKLFKMIVCGPQCPRPSVANRIRERFIYSLRKFCPARGLQLLSSAKSHWKKNQLGESIRQSS
jgi:hypothetical protein